MSLSMYEASIPVFIRAFRNLSAILDKAVAHVEAKNLHPATLIEARLASDMGTLSFQVQRASDTAKGCAARLAGINVPSFDDTETTFPELQTRIAKTTGFLQTVNAEHLDGSEKRVIRLKFPNNSLDFDGKTYLLAFALPNFFFHITTAYDILRHSGVEIGKMDYIGSF